MSKQNIKHYLRVLIGVALLAGINTQALAIGTAAGTDVDNTATITFSVGGIPQPPQDSNTETFVVDNRIDVDVTVTATNVPVTPGQVGGPVGSQLPNPPAVLAFTVTNEGNSVQDFELSTVEAVAGDDFDPTTTFIFVESGANPGYQPAEDTATFIDELSADAGLNSITVYVIASVPTGLANGNTSDIALVATAREGGSAGGAVGAAITEATGANVAGTVENVFADGAGTDDAAFNANESDRGTYVIATSAVTVTKSSAVIDDGIAGNPAANLKAIPGATVRYTIAIANTGGSLAVTSIGATDDLDTDVTIVNGDNSSVTFDAGCGGATSSSFTAPTLTFNVGSIAAGATCNVSYDVIIN